MMLETLANSTRSIIYTLSSQLFYAAFSIILCHIALQVIKNDLQISLEYERKIFQVMNIYSLLFGNLFPLFKHILTNK